MTTLNLEGKKARRSLDGLRSMDDIYPSPLDIAVLSCYQDAAIRVRVTGCSGNQDARKTCNEDTCESRHEDSACDENSRVLSRSRAANICSGLCRLLVATCDEDSVCEDRADAEDRDHNDCCEDVFDGFHFLLLFF